MKRAELEHILRACSGNTGEQHFIIVGSQSVLGKHPDAPRELRVSMELDIYARDKPEETRVEIERNLGELPRFAETFDYYADPVGPETALLPAGWESRLTPVCNENTGGATGWCIDPADLAIAKLAAARAKDIAFIRVMLTHHLIRRVEVERLIATFDDAALRQRLGSAFAACLRPEESP